MRHPLGPSLCSLSLKLQSQPEIHLPVRLSLDGNGGYPQTHAPFDLSIPSEFTGQRAVNERILNNIPLALRQFNAARESSGRRTHNGASRPSYTPVGDAVRSEGEGQDAEWY